MDSHGRTVFEIAKADAAAARKGSLRRLGLAIVLLTAVATAALITWALWRMLG